MMKVKNIVIMGGGTAGWLSALYCIEKYNKNGVKVSIIEPSDIPIIGVGEGTVDSFFDFLEDLNVDIKEFIKETRGSVKHGINFVDWLEIGKDYWHPFYFNSPGSLQLVSLACCSKDFNDLFMNTTLAKQNKSCFNPEKRSFAGAHFDSALVCKYLKKICIDRGVELIDNSIESVVLGQEDDYISHLILKNKDTFKADFYIDCSGFKSLLLAKTFKEKFVDFSEHLVCDSALVMRTSHLDDENINAFTEAKAQKHGWTWRIPVYDRVGNGYVYSSKISGYDEVAKDFQEHLNLKDVDFKKVEFKVGFYENVFKGNSVSVGLSSGFIEPLEATGLMFVTRTLNAMDLYISEDKSLAEVNEFVQKLYYSTRDFIFLHYRLSKRNDTKFWKEIKKIPYPISLKTNLNSIITVLNKTNKESVENLKKILDPWDLRAYLLVLRGMDFHELHDNIKELNLSYNEILEDNISKSEPYYNLSSFLSNLHQ